MAGPVVSESASAVSERDAKNVSGGAVSEAPDWNLVHFDVGCARCGHDLHGLVEPKCPACELEFAWSQAVPLEELTCTHCDYHLYGLSERRCPECGLAFTWEEALADYYLRRKRHFEYLWRRKPVRSFLHSLSCSVRPWRLWRELTLHDPPRVPALTALWMLGALVMIGVPVLETLVFRQTISLLQGPSQWVTFFGSYFSPFDAGDGVAGLLVLMAWSAMVFLVLVSMRWSLAKCNVRWQHLLRVCTHLVLSVCWIPPLIFVFLFLSDLNELYGVLPEHAVFSLLSVANWSLFAVAIVWTVMSLGLAYRHYIRMPHAWGVSAAASIAGMLSALIATVFAGMASAP